ncbi:hypothetical protein GGI55_001788 [Rhizobium leguminosarum]|uniref:hypothetical protein n=1 Tax=Rhizobium TaxID=379 RepID=UPI00160741F5|nr:MULTISPECIES: hypothetical protein [Rhizobium]MBB4297261.1 hypothetical protein [Rhizobium leguminosarum]MBB4415313.1 hypothetical protein [Rhizobium leguminosarum]MBB4431720.1 hypothetical protein [Rhizobium esperanzae]MBB4539664.1 hypothetical protein [Rhizobium leguminosarum]MBB5651943.1 hypothetical protein [Rhizobium leguminosarum]
MPNTSIPATAEGMPKATRRALLWGLAAASTAAAVAVAPDAHGAIATGAQALAGDQAENPELISAYQKFYEACVERNEAQQAREWLADEWKHRWPLAPEALLWGANAQDGRYTDDGERDIIGRYLIRDTADLTKRMSAKYRRANPKTCFALLTSSRERSRIEDLKKSTPKGRTPKALARNQALRNEAIRKCERNIVLAEHYEAETARLRRISGADTVQQRVTNADAWLRKAADEVSQCEARTLAGLGMKADVLAVTAGDLMELTKSDATPLGQMARFIESVAEIAGRAAA